MPAQVYDNQIPPTVSFTRTRLGALDGCLYLTMSGKKSFFITKLCIKCISIEIYRSFSWFGVNQYMALAGNGQESLIIGIFILDF